MLLEKASRMSMIFAAKKDDRSLQNFTMVPMQVVCVRMLLVPTHAIAQTVHASQSSLVG